MSEWRERYDESPGLASTFEWLESYYQYVVGAFVLVFMLYTRIRTWDNFIVDGEVLFSSNDPWYHFRNTVYAVEHWPATMPFDPWTNFPQGNAAGQFGTFFDQIMATVAMVVGLGSPSEELVALVVLFVPVIMGVLIAIPTYVMGRRIGGRFGGIVALVVVALSAGRFLSVGLVGTSDHHIAEALFQVLAVLGVMVAVGVAQRDKPIYEQFSERTIAPIRATVGWSVLAGFAITAYLWVWPPGVLLIAVLGIYFLLQLSLEFFRGESPEHTAIAGAITMTTAGVTVSSGLNVLDITATSLSLLQPALAFIVAFGCVFMAWLARFWESRDQPRWQYPVTVFGIVAAGVVLLRLVTPDLFSYFLEQAQRVVGFTTTPTAGTVGEAAPIPFSQAQLLFEWHGFAVIIAVAAAAWIVGKAVLGRELRAEMMLLVVWLVFMIAATFTQRRFDYYLVVPAAVLTGYAVGSIFTRFDLQFDANGFELYKSLSVIAVVLILVVPMAVGPSTALGASAGNAPGNGIQGWSDSLDWMQNNTPEEGYYADDTQELEYYGTYPRQDDFDYEPGAYGVLSWWDYGHWITVQGERIPTANPHQQGSSEAANFLLAGNETQANDVMTTMAEDDAETRYVMVDWKMVHTNSDLNPLQSGTEVNGKYFAPFQFYDGEINERNYYQRLFTEQFNGQLRQFTYRTQDYYESMSTRLYEFHGSAVEPEPVVLDWEARDYQGQQLPMTPGENGTALQYYESMDAAQEAVENDQTAQIGGIGGNPAERVSALEHYRLVGTSERDATSDLSYRLSEMTTAAGATLNASVLPPGETCGSDLSLPLQGGQQYCLNEGAADFMHDTSTEWTKIFERVPGATVEGTGPANTNVTAFVPMRNHVTNETFDYHQRVETDSNGEFTMTVPYSTTGYDQWGTEERRTNVSVRATSQMQFGAITADNGSSTAWRTQADVPEAAVIGEQDDPVTVELEEVENVPEGEQAIENGTSSG